MRQTSPRLITQFLKAKNEAIAEVAHELDRSVSRVFREWEADPLAYIVVDLLTFDVLSRMGCEGEEYGDSLYRVFLPGGGSVN